MTRALFSSTQVCALTGCTVRQINYWDHQGRFGRQLGRGSGADKHRRFTFPEVVLVRAYVLAAQVMPQATWDERCWPLADQVTAAWEHDESLAGVRLVVEADRAYVGFRTRAPAALIVNLAACARHVTAPEQDGEAA